MAEANHEDILKKYNFRLCELCTWPNYVGLGFQLEKGSDPPYIVQIVDSNSPACAAGLKIRDVILAVNGEELSDAAYKEVTTAIGNAKNSGGPIELLVIEKRFYDLLNGKGVMYDPTLAKKISAPTTMPSDYMNFPKNKPRTCDVRLNKKEDSLGFETANGEKDIGLFIQEVKSDSPAGRALLRKSDRILEIDDKFVDKEPSKNILGIIKEKKNRGLKLYVVDTHTYKYFQENKIPLASKEFKKSKFAKTYQPTPSYMNTNDVPPVNDDANNTKTTPSNRQSKVSKRVTAAPQHQDDIRLCTINRANATDTFGLEYVYIKRGGYHSLKLKPNRDGGQSNAELAGIKNDDYIIEINGENIEKLTDEQMKKRLHAIKYPQPLELLVTNADTYEHYKQKKEIINSNLQVVQQLPANQPSRQSTTTRPVSTSIRPPVDDPSVGIGGLITHNPLQAGIPTRDSQTNQRRCQLRRIQGFKGFGFSVNSNQTDAPKHKITDIAKNSPADKYGLRVGDYILTINDQDVQQMSPPEFKQFLPTAATEADSRGDPLILEVINEDAVTPVIQEIARPTSKPRSTVSSVREPSNTEEPYPEMRLCTIKSWPQQQHLGFQITQSPSSFGGDDGYRIQRVEGDSPAAMAHIYNGDYIIEVNHRNIENQDYQYVQDLINDTYQNAKEIQLLVIDETGYQWYKQHQYTFNPLSSQAKVTHYKTPDPPPVLTTNQNYTNGYKRQTDEPVKPRLKSASRPRLSKGAVDVVSGKRLLRYCTLETQAGQPFGFQLMPNNNEHIIYHIDPKSPADRAGLKENDRLLEVDNENVEDKPKKDVAAMIQNAGQTGKLRLLIAPNNILPLSNRSAKSLLTVKDYEASLIKKKPSFSKTDFPDNLADPNKPLPRKCVLIRDSYFRGCGLRVTEKENCDTPIIVDVYPNSPAKRSGLTEGDHIIYIDSQNVQALAPFNNITQLIQETFEKNGQITLVTLTDSAYQVLKKRGGYLENDVFDYQSIDNNPLKPYLCKLNLDNHEHDFGLTFKRENSLYIKSIEQGSSADICGIRKGDIVLELNGQDTKYLSMNQIREITEKSIQDKKLDILIIDVDGYSYSLKHAIPLNSLLSFVQIREGRVASTTTTTTAPSTRIQYETVYL